MCQRTGLTAMLAMLASLHPPKIKKYPKPNLKMTGNAQAASM
jgi:hypothetical protein